MIYNTIQVPTWMGPIEWRLSFCFNIYIISISFLYNLHAECDTLSTSRTSLPRMIRVMMQTYVAGFWKPFVPNLVPFKPRLQWTGNLLRRRWPKPQEHLHSHPRNRCTWPSPWKVESIRLCHQGSSERLERTAPCMKTIDLNWYWLTR